MKVSDLVNGYKKACKSGTGETYLEKHIKAGGYIPYTQKVAEAERIARTTTLKDGKICVNTPGRFYITQLRKIALLSDIEIDFSDAVGQFDLLDEAGLIDIIVGKILPQHEVNTFDALVSMACDDLMTNKYDVHAYVDEVLDLLNRVAKDMTEPLQKQLEEATKEQGERV